MSIASDRAHAPMMAMNTTPLIDLMLVLLIMFIITIPVQTHAVKLDLPGKRPPPPAELVDPVRNKVVITQGGRILWNSATVGIDELRARLELVARHYPDSELHLQPEAAARYALVDEVLALTKQARVERMGFVGNEQYANF